jgi:hypothetical protein
VAGRVDEHLKLLPRKEHLTALQLHRIVRHVDDNAVWTLSGTLQSFRSVIVDKDIESIFLEIILQASNGVRFIVDDEKSIGHGWCT